MAISRICALWIITLILLPFTAPFKTYDLGNDPSNLHDWLPKDKSDSGEKLAPAASWVLLPLGLSLSTAAHAACLTRVDEYRLPHTLLRL